MPNNFCQSCGNPIMDNYKFCRSCGKANNNFISSSPVHTNTNPIINSPLTVSEYLLMIFISTIPFVGLILLIVWAFSADININRRNISRALLLFYLVLTVVALILLAILIPLLAIGVIKFLSF